MPDDLRGSFFPYRREHRVRRLHRAGAGMTIIVIETRNEHGSQFRTEFHSRREADREMAILRRCSAYVESFGHAPLIITETLESAA
jgi:hypothetical protein